MSDARSGPPPRLFLDIDAAMRRGDMAAATAMARRGLEQNYSHPVLFSLRAYWHETEGRFEPACTDLQRALALAPGDSRTLNALGRCRTENGQLTQALAALAAALAAEPGLAVAHYNIAFAYEQLGELDRAWEGYGRARQLDPKMVDAVARLASLASRRGDRKEARTLADSVLAIQPRHPVAIFAHVVCDLTEGQFADAERRASAVAKDESVVAQARVNAMSFVADALDGQERWPEAFAQYTAANDELKALFCNRFEGAGRETGRKLAERLAREFASYPAQASQEISTPLPGDAAGIVFLLGFPRSGTTLLGQILAAHSNVVTIEEKPLLGDGIGTYIQQPGGLVRLATLGPEEIERHRAAFFERVRDHGVQTKGRVVIDQTPLNTLHLPLIAKLFPEARIVFAVRDPRDVVLSCFRRLFVVNTYVYEFLSLTGGTHFYDETMKLVELFRSALPLAWHDIRNEDLIADFDGEVRRLCAFLGLAYEDSMRDFAKSSQARRIATPSAMQVIRGIRGDGVGHWRNYEAELAPVLPVLAPWVERFGYE